MTSTCAFMCLTVGIILLLEGRLLSQGYQVELGQDWALTKSPCGSKIPLHPTSSPWFTFVYKTLTSLFDRVDFDLKQSVLTLHQQFKPKTSEPISNENTISRHHLLVLSQHAVSADRWYFGAFRNALIRCHKRHVKNLSTLKELQADQLSWRRKANFERLL